jgi:SAM-dependent methyltransferase
MSMLAAETRTLEQTVELYPQTREWVRKVLARVAPLLGRSTDLVVLEIGCAQGRGLVALREFGHTAVGVEPYEPALDVASQFAALHGVDIETAVGVAESIPFGDDRFDLVLAFSVLEHVTDLQESLREIHRVLKPGGVFWFDSASAMCPFQDEIAHVPLFGWYPDRLKRRIMLWARDTRPAWIGNTTAPAIHWWTAPKARRELTAAGFEHVVDRWDLSQPDELTGARGRVARYLRQRRRLRPLGDIAIRGCSYAAVKPKPVRPST